MKMTKEELKDSLLSKITELGRTPSFTEVKEDQNMPDPNDFAYHFGSFTDAVRSAWEEYEFEKRKASGRSSLTIKKPIKIKKPG